jgi:hypothetical protein
MKRAEQVAVEAVAAHFSVPWKEGPSGAYLAIGGKRVAVAIAAVKPQIPAKQRLRFDRVALELLRRLQAALQDSVPDGRTVVLTVTAPIRQSGKTAAALEEKIKAGLAHRRATLNLTDSIQGNSIRARLMKGGNPKVIGFVHNPDPNSDVLLDLTQSLLERVSLLEKKRVSTRSERWLVIADDESRPHIEAYRYIASQLSGFKKIVLVGGGRVETLSD